MNINKVCEAVMGSNVIRATQYISPKFIIRAVRKRYHKKIRAGNIEISLTIGKPNWAERNFIKLCQKAGEPFPIKKTQIKEYNPKLKKLKRSNLKI